LSEPSQDLQSHTSREERTKTQVSKIRKLAAALKEKYDHEASALEVLELSDGRYVMQLKPEYSKSVKRLATRQLLTPGPMKTLSYIALRQPVTQSHVVKVRGNLAYGHVKQLNEMGLISGEKLGRSKLLRTTPSFADYFNLSQDPKLMKGQIQKIFEDIKSTQTGGAPSTGPQEPPPKPDKEQSPTQSSEPACTTNPQT
jgi:segregation and condensation protein B